MTVTDYSKLDERYAYKFVLSYVFSSVYKQLCPRYRRLVFVG